LMIKDEMKDNSISDILNKERWMLIWKVVREKSTISKLQHFLFLHPISSNHQFLTLLARSTLAPCLIKIRHISGWWWAQYKGVSPHYLKNHQLKEIMKFILQNLEHSLLLLLLTKTKQPPIVHLPNLKNLKSQHEEECFHAKISQISSN